MQDQDAATGAQPYDYGVHGKPYCPVAAQFPDPNRLSNGEHCAWAGAEGTDAWNEHDHRVCQDAAEALPEMR
jgi:hypothetical protein